MPVPPPFSGLNLPEVFPLATIAESFALDLYITQLKPKSALIVGTGYTGLEMVNALTHRGIEMIVLEFLGYGYRRVAVALQKKEILKMTGQIGVDQLESFIFELLQAAGLTPTNARTVAMVYLRATLRGVGHHDINELANRLSLIESGRVEPNPNITLLHKFQAVESYDGNNGLGEICCSFIMEQAMRLADEYGIGFCTVRHSNHFLAASSYAEQAAEKNYLGLIYSRSVNSMGAPGASRNFLGNNPFGFAVMSDQGFPLMLDISMAYSSYGKLNEKIKAGETVPEYWGMNAYHQPTSDPKEILRGGMFNPVAGHKGLGLALLGEIMTGVLSNGEILDETNPNIPSPEISSQTAIAIKIDALMPVENFQARVSDIINRVKELEPDVKMPGRQSFENKRHSLLRGLELDPALVTRLNEWAAKLKVPPLQYMTGPK